MLKQESKVAKNSKITVGGDAIGRIKQIKADLCFMGVNAIDPGYGITDNDWGVVQIKRAMIGSAQKVVCPIEDIDVLITELPADSPLLERYRKKGIQIL